MTQEPQRKITKYPVKTEEKETFPKEFVKNTTGSVKIKINKKSKIRAKNFTKTFFVVEIGKLSKVSFFRFQTFIVKVGITKMQIYGIDKKNWLKLEEPKSKEKKFPAIKWKKLVIITKKIAAT